MLESKIDLLPTSQGFIAQPVENHTGIAYVLDLNPVVALKSFLFSGQKAIAQIATHCEVHSTHFNIPGRSRIFRTRTNPVHTKWNAFTIE